MSSQAWFHYVSKSFGQTSERQGVWQALGWGRARCWAAGGSARPRRDGRLLRSDGELYYLALLQKFFYSRKLVICGPQQLLLNIYICLIIYHFMSHCILSSLYFIEMEASPDRKK